MAHIKNKYPYSKGGRLRPKLFMDTYVVQSKPNPKTDDTIMREMVLKEIEERCSKGENIEAVAEEIASRKEIQEHFSYFKKNNINTPLKDFFINWYLGKQKNSKRISKIDRWWEDSK